MGAFVRQQWAGIMVIAALVFVPAAAYADRDGGTISTAEDLGWLAVGCGIAANLSLVGFKVVMKTPVMRLVGGRGIQGLAPMYRPVMDFHVMLNSVGFFAGLLHGFALVRGLDYISLSLAIVMTVSMVSGMLLRFVNGRNMKIVNRMVHGQVVIAAMLVTLVALHIITRWHHGVMMGLL
ncbi:MAG: hypothetical protein KGI33_03375 [Thaumarchaeota archaeon]|nr:hypothetical protein [Nitrososphaerota archaeon]